MSAALPYDILLENSLSLSPQERSRLASRLIESLNEQATEEMSSAWSVEIERRMNAVRDGTMRTIAHEEVMAEMEAMLADIQAEKRAA